MKTESPILKATNTSEETEDTNGMILEFLY